MFSDMKRRTKITDHKRNGKTLIPPLASIPNMQPRSWRDDRFPEMLWAALLVANLERSEALHYLRIVIKVINELPEESRPSDVSLSGMSMLDSEVLDSLVQPLLVYERCKTLLSYLNVYDSLPRREYWLAALGEPSPDKAWPALMNAAARNLDHQTQEATDCRWIRIMAKISAGKLILPTRELCEELFYYPNRGDQRSVRPSVRAIEISSVIESSKLTEWPGKFWQESFDKTYCFPMNLSSRPAVPVAGTTADVVSRTYRALADHYIGTIAGTKVDPRHDTVFGLGLYALSVLSELLRMGNAQAIIGRLSLRCLSEIYIVLSYLMMKNKQELWRSFRVYGAGQAKVVSLKLDEATHDVKYVRQDDLDSIANEDIWEEYLSIDVGHWDRSSLRQMSIDAGLKHIYDEYYNWTSSYTHGHWCAVRDSVLDCCGNPLHRLHRMPRDGARLLPDVIYDSCHLVDLILEAIEKQYPPFADRVSIRNA